MLLSHYVRDEDVQMINVSIAGLTLLVTESVEGTTVHLLKDGSISDPLTTEDMGELLLQVVKEEAVKEMRTYTASFAPTEEL